MNEFVEAVSSGDPVNLKNTIDLFDESRKPGILERAFTPQSWRNNQVRKYFPRRADGSYDVPEIYSQVQTQRDKLADRASGIDAMAEEMSNQSGGSRDASPRRPSNREGTPASVQEITSGSARRSSRCREREDVSL